jgi:hypothetical protein
LTFNSELFIPEGVLLVLTAGPLMALPVIVLRYHAAPHFVQKAHLANVEANERITAYQEDRIDLLRMNTWEGGLKLEVND